MTFTAIPQLGNVTPLSPVGFLTPIGPRSINTVPLDVVVRESIAHTVVVTDHPIEVGKLNGVARGTISDNAYVAPTVYIMEGGVSDLPISWRLFRKDAPTAHANSKNETRSISAYQILLRHLRELIPFTLKTPYGDIEDALFRSFTVNRDQSSKSAIIFSAEFVQLQMVIPEGATINSITEESLSGEQAQTQAVDEVDLGETSLQAVA